MVKWEYLAHTKRFFASLNMPPDPDDCERDENDIFHVSAKEVQERKEYQALQRSELNELGSKGWELVSVLEHDNATTFFFKRPVE